MTRKGRRLTLIGTALGVLGIAAGLILFALRDNVVFFYAPNEVAQKNVQPGTRLRIGGLVKVGSVRKGDKTVDFTVTDNVRDLNIRYEGALPDLFREGQGVVVEGILQAAGDFQADSVLAKHDETYMPRDVADALKKQGRWREGEPAKAEPVKPNPVKISEGQGAP